MRLASPPSRTTRLLLWVVPLALAGAAVAQTATQSESATSGGHRPTAEVNVTGGLLSVSATDASLNQIVHEIARQTGMKVTGSVPNLPVFGTYGPSRPAIILSTLLDGSGSNYLYVDATAAAPAQLTLTPRTGAATPPNPQAAAHESNEDQDNLFSRAPNAQFQPPPSPPATNAPPPQNAGQFNNREQPTSTSQPVVFPAVGATTPSSTANSTPANPDDPATNGVKTPQQIFEQLQRLRAQQNQGASHQ